MNSIRPVLKTGCIILWTLSCYAVYIFIYGLLRLFGIGYEGWRNKLMRFWSGGCCNILSLKITAMGTPPDAPFFLVSNHLSYIDILPLYQHLNCTFVAKKEVRSWPLLGFMVMTMGVIFVDRSRKRDVTRVNELISGALNKKQGVVIFPEGKTSPGKEVLPFRSPLLQYPASQNIPVHYAAIRYETAEGDLPASESVCWYGGEDFGKHTLKLAATRKINCTITFSETAPAISDRKELTDKLHEGVNELFVPMD